VAVGLESEELAFERALERFARYRGFTERLVAEREARAFEDFEREVELYLAKVALTKSLAARQTGAPSW
jgi:hypothetical protein